MVNLICGSIGSGKTQKLIDSANDELRNTDGLIVFIDGSNKHQLNIDKEIRFINAKEFMIDNTDKFFGFLCGIISGNYDICSIYIDNIESLTKVDDTETLKEIISDINDIAKINQVKFHITLNTLDPEVVDIDQYESKPV